MIRRSGEALGYWCRGPLFGARYEWSRIDVVIGGGGDHCSVGGPSVGRGDVVIGGGGGHYAVGGSHGRGASL